MVYGRYGVSGDMVYRETWCIGRHGVSGDMVYRRHGVSGDMVHNMRHDVTASNPNSISSEEEHVLFIIVIAEYRR